MPKDKDAPIDADIKELSLGLVGIAWLANTPAARHDKEAQQLVKRWKTLHGKYAALSKQYAALMVRMASLQFPNPAQIWKAYDELDAEFDALAPAMHTLHDDLKKWEQENVSVETVTDQKEISTLNAITGE
jgi:hypothetical protein